MLEFVDYFKCNFKERKIAKKLYATAFPENEIYPFTLIKECLKVNEVLCTKKTRNRKRCFSITIFFK